MKKHTQTFLALATVIGNIFTVEFAFAKPGDGEVGCAVSGTSTVTQTQVVTYTLAGDGSCTPTGWGCSCGTVQGYTTSAPYTVTIFFDQTSCSSATITAYNGSTSLATTSVTVNSIPTLTSGSVSNTSQNINYNTIPAAITVSSPSGGYCSSYTYTWESSTNNVSFSVVSGATGSSYTAPQLVATHYYRRVVHCGDFTATTGSATVNVYPQLHAGAITLSDSLIDFNTSVTATLSGASGGTGTYSYQWKAAPSSTGPFTIISGTGTSNTRTHVTAATWYKALVTSNSVTDSTASVKIALYAELNPGVLTPSAQTLVFDHAPATISLSGTSGGRSAYSYQWQIVDPVSDLMEGDWSDLPDTTTSLTLSSAPSAPKWYRVKVTSGPFTKATSQAAIYAYNYDFVIAPDSQNVRSDVAAADLSVPDYQAYWLQYEWSSSSTANGTYTVIAGADSRIFSPGVVSNDTYYKARIYGDSVNRISPHAVIRVRPGIVKPVISPMHQVVSSGTVPGTLTATPASGGQCSGSFSYVWQSSTDNIHFTNLSETSLQYSPGTLTATKYYRIRVACGADSDSSKSVVIHIAPAVAQVDLNYITTRVIFKDSVTTRIAADDLSSPFDVAQTTQYVDGLGRPIQTVARQGSPSMADMIHVQEYDEFDRETDSFLPFVDSTNIGLFRNNGFAKQYAFNAAQFAGEKYFFAQTRVENSPLSRPVMSTAAGLAWTGSNRAVTGNYLVNAASDSVFIWSVPSDESPAPVVSGTYGAGQLFKTITSDEQAHQTIEYKDKLDHVILKKVQVSSAPGAGHTGWACTYYIYDDNGNLMSVLAPQAVKTLLN